MAKPMPQSPGLPLYMGDRLRLMPLAVSCCLKASARLVNPLQPRAIANPIHEQALFWPVIMQPPPGSAKKS